MGEREREGEKDKGTVLCIWIGDGERKGRGDKEEEGD